MHNYQLIQTKDVCSVYFNLSQGYGEMSDRIGWLIDWF